MRVISKSRLVQFWERPDCNDSEGPLRAWYAHVGSRTVDWSSWADVKAEFATASHVGNCVVFNIGGNKYRLIARVLLSKSQGVHPQGDDASRVQRRQMERGVWLLRVATPKNIASQRQRKGNSWQRLARIDSRERPKIRTWSAYLPFR